MLVKTLVEKMNNKNQVMSLSKLIETKQYLPFTEKKALVERIIDNCTTTDNGFVQINEIDQYIQFTIETIKTYTNIEFGDSPIADYDLLCSSGLLGDIIATFDGEYKMILNLVEMQKRYVLSQNSVESQIIKFLNSLGADVDVLAMALKDKIDEFNVNFNPEDIGKLTDFINNSK